MLIILKSVIRVLCFPNKIKLQVKAFKILLTLQIYCALTFNYFSPSSSLYF